MREKLRPLSFPRCCSNVSVLVLILLSDFCRYRGLGVNLIRVVPSTAVTFVTYEKLNSFLLAPADDDEEEGSTAG